MTNFSIWQWLCVGFVVWLACRLLIPPRPAISDGPALGSGAGRRDRAPGHLLEVVDENFYQDNLRQLFPPNRLAHAVAGDECSAVAVLRLEDDNPKDNQAVAVYIGGLKVGHLARDVALAHRCTRGPDEGDVTVDAVVSIPDQPGHDYSVTLNGNYNTPAG